MWPPLSKGTPLGGYDFRENTIRIIVSNKALTRGPAFHPSSGLRRGKLGVQLLACLEEGSYYNNHYYFIAGRD